jgi:hypothetical protein
MTLLEFIRDIAPSKCGVHPAYGKIAELVFNVEKETGMFAAEDFVSTRERAGLAAPYPGGEEREKVLDVIELAICTHRQAKHNEDHSETIALLSAKPMEAEELEMATRDWWIQ